MRRALLALLLMLLWATPPAAETRSLALEHRTGAQIQALLHSLADTGVDIAADGQRLLLQGETEQLDALEEAARALDHPPRDLWLRLRRPGGGSGADSGSRRYTTADPRAVTLRLREGESVSWDRSTLERVAGDRALAAGRRGPALLEDGHLLWLRQGLRARVHILGERFLARLEAAGDDVLDGTPRRDRLATTVSGPLGQWVSVHGPSAGPPDPEVRRYATRPGTGRSAGLEMRVDLADP